MMRVPSLPLLLAGLALLAGAGAFLLWPEQRPLPGAALDGAALAAALEALDEDEDAGAGAPSAGPLRFPADHGPHPDSRGELWDLSALVGDDRGHRYGLRLGFVRVALAPAPRQRASDFAAEAVVAARFAIAAEGNGPAVVAVRASRTALGLAGAAHDAAAGDPSAAAASTVWVGDWRLTRRAGGLLRVEVADDAGAAALTLTPDPDPLVADAAELLERGPGGAGAPALRLYLQPRLAVSGTLTLDGVRRPVTGIAWLDHGWGALGTVVGGRRGRLALNRFELMLDGGPTLACIQLRRQAGGGTPVPSCLVIAADGATGVLRRRDLTLEPAGARWTSPDGVAYPLHWRLAAPALDLTLDIRPLIPDQRQALGVPIWSGIVVVEGRQGGAAINGSGRMDLTGYAGAAAGT